MTACALRWPGVVDEGIENRSTRDLLALVLRRESEYGLLDRAGGITALCDAEPNEIASWLAAETNAKKNGGVGPRAAMLKSANALAAAFELGRRAEIARQKPPERFDSAEKVAEWARPRLVHLAHEELWLIAVDGRGHARTARCLARGGIHGAAVRTCDPLRIALRVGASAFVLVHNHPSGEPTPSKEDISLTAHVAEAARIVGIALLDHIIVARNGFVSVPDS